MKTRQKNSQLERIVEEFGAQLLDGSGFEDEKPEGGFSGAVLLPSTYLPDRPKASRQDQQ